MKTDNQMLVEQFNESMFSDLMLTFLAVIIVLATLWMLSEAWSGIKRIRKELKGLHEKRNNEFADELRRLQKSEKK